MRINKSIITTVLLLSNVLFSRLALGQENYPVPVKTEKMLFYFQRSHNKNTVIYELNTNASGQIDMSKPVHYYWIRYEEGGIRKELSFIQQKAFGLHYQVFDKAKGSFIIQFNSFKKRDIYLMKVGSSAVYKAYIKINGELSELGRMYIKSDNNSLGIPLSVKYVEISGINLKTGEPVTEKYVP